MSSIEAQSEHVFRQYAKISDKRLVQPAYKPNLNDPRLKSRVKIVLAWCDKFLLSKRPIPVNHESLREVFSNTSRNPGQWLYSNLLFQTGTYVVGKKCYQYSLNQDGYRKIHDLFGIEMRCPHDVASEKFSDYVSGAEPIPYRDSGDRRYHAVQNLKRDLRTKVFSKWWDYDIDACAPTLLYQYVSEGRGDGWGEKWLPTIRRLAFEKDTMRKHVQELIGLEEKKVKRVLNAIFFKAVVAPHSASTVFRDLGQSEELLYRLKNDAAVKTLRREVRFMWELAHNRYSVDHASMVDIWKKIRTPPASRSKQRNAIYRMLERQVINAMEEILPASLLGCVLMHDGFMLKDRVDVRKLETVVRQRTGYSITLKETCLSQAGAEDEPDPLHHEQDNVSSDVVEA